MFYTTYKNILIRKIKNGQLLDLNQQPCPDIKYEIGGLDGDEGNNAPIQKVIVDDELNLISNYKNSFLIVENMLELIKQQNLIIDQLLNGILPSNSGGNIKGPDFDVNMQQIKNDIQKLNDKINKDKKRFY